MLAATDPAAKKKSKERGKDKKAECTQCAVTLGLNAETFSFFFLSLSLEAKEGGKFMALQLLSWLL